MSTKIKLTELLADREAGTGGEWVVGVGSENGRPCVDTSTGIPVEVAECRGTCFHSEIDEACHANARRIARLPALEAGYIEAVELLEQWRTWSCSKTGASPFQETRTFLGETI